MKKIIIFNALLAHALQGQVGILNYNQVPMLLHPSMVGSNDGKRASIVYGVMESPIPLQPSVQKNYYAVSYDQLWRKIGSGMGGYLNVAQAPNNNMAIASYMAPYTKLKELTVCGGISFAPKYSRMKKDGEEIMFTWSPSLSINYNYDRSKYSVEVPSDNPTGLTPYSVLIQKSVSILTSSLGALVNNKVVKVGATFNHELWTPTYKDADSRTDVSHESDKYSYNVFGGSVMAGVSFPKREKSLLGLSYTHKTTLSWYPVEDHKSRSVYHNVNLRVWRILFGICGATSRRNYFYANSISTKNFHIGFKANKWKATVGISHYKQAEYYGVVNGHYGPVNVTNRYYFGETTFTYTF